MRKPPPEDPTDRVRAFIREKTKDWPGARADFWLSKAEVIDWMKEFEAKLLTPRVECPTCNHVWGAYEDTCHCADGQCHNQDACQPPAEPEPERLPPCGINHAGACNVACCDG